jgi:hypothetical protein
VGGVDGAVRVYDRTTGELVHRLRHKAMRKPTNKQRNQSPRAATLWRSMGVSRCKFLLILVLNPTQFMSGWTTPYFLLRGTILEAQGKAEHYRIYVLF